MLVSLDLDAPDADQLNAIFRAAHSIKGGSGTFGFTDMTEVTHILETLLDRIRKNEIAITREMVDAFLEAGDVLRRLLDAHQNGLVADETASNAVCAKLDNLANSKAASDNQNSQSLPKAALRHPVSKKVGNKLQPLASTELALPSSTAMRSDTEAPNPSVQYVYQVQFAKTRAAFPSKAHLESLLEDLGNLGKITNKKITANSVAFSLATYATEAELREIFAFFLKPKQLSIRHIGAVPRGDSPADQDYGFFDGSVLETTQPDVEGEQGYGFFEEPEAVKSRVENALGYGFFEDPEKIKARAEDAQGYGFFDDLVKRPAPEPETNTQQVESTPHRRAEDFAPHRRATDSPPLLRW